MKIIRIRTKILASILITSMIIIIILSTIHYFFEMKLASTYTNHTMNAIKKIAQKSDEISNQYLTPFTENYLQVIVDDIGDEIEFLKHEFQEKLSNDIIRRDQNLIKTMERYTKLKETTFIEMLIIDQNEIVLSSSTDDIGKDYHPWIQSCPELKINTEKDQNYKGYYDFKINSKTVHIYLNLHHVKGTNYDVVAFLNLETYLAPSNKIKNEKVKEELNRLKSTTDKFLHETLFLIGLVSLIVVVIIVLICIPISLYFATTVTKPIIRLRREVMKIGKGNFDVRLEEQGSLEVMDLIKTFNFLGGQLKEYMDNLAKEIQSKQLIESQIKIAANIQSSLLPEVTEKFIRSEFTLGAKLVPAVYGTSGDYYDFYYIPGDKIAVVVADVSGKGISAAFFMAFSKTILQNLCEKEPSPAKALLKLNDVLTTNNKEFMFVTVFLIYYDLKTGKITYANAGHHPTTLVNKQKEIKYFGENDNTAAGIFKTSTYDEGELQIEPGETIIMYTDGITEAISPEQEQFGEKRIEKLISENISLEPQELSEKVVDSITEFEATNKPFDDKTVIVFRRNK